MTLIRRACLLFAVALLLSVTTPDADANELEQLNEDAESRSVFNRFAEPFGTVNRRHERALATYYFDTDLRTYRMMSGQTTRAWEYQYEAPNRLWINLEATHVICDGEQLWAAEYVTDRYALQAAPGRTELSKSIEAVLGEWGKLPLTLAMLLSQDPDDQYSLLGGSLVITGHADEVREGAACVRLEFVSKNIPNPPSTDPVTMAGVMWFAEESGALLAIEIDMREAMQEVIRALSDDVEALEMMGLTADDDIDELFRSATILIEIETLPDHPIDEEALRLPDSGALELVDSFGSTDFVSDATDDAAAAGDLMPKDFLGEAAPPLQGRDQRGKFFDSSDHRGEVLVLVVGSSFRPGQVASWLREAEDIQDAFQRMPVQVVGLINPIDEFIDEVEIDTDAFSIPIIRDEDDRLISAFRISMRPVLFLIDQDGVVQVVLENRSDFKAELLIDDIRSLLGGDDLIDSDALDARREELRQARAAREERSPTLTLGEVGIERVRTKHIHRWGRSNRAPMEAVLRVCDVDRDGIPDIVTCDGGARLIVIDGSDLSIRTIDLESVQNNDVSIVAFDQIRTSRGLGWAIVTSRYSPFGDQSTETVGVFLDDGTKIRRWTLEAPNDETIYTHSMGRIFDVGDLDGDGIDEIAVGISLSSDHADTEDMLVLFDAEGEVLFAKEVQYGFDSVRIVPAADGKPGWVSTSNFSGVRRFEFER